MKCGSDGALRVFPDDPRDMPPISCLLEGCEKVWFTTISHNYNEIYEGCDAVRNQCSKKAQVCSPPDPKTYTTMWQEVPAEEVLLSCPLLKLKLGPKRLLLHKRRVTEAMCEGEVPAPL